MYQQGLYKYCMRVLWSPSCVEMLSYGLIVYMEEGRKTRKGRKRGREGRRKSREMGEGWERVWQENKENIR